MEFDINLLHKHVLRTLETRKNAHQNIQQSRNKLCRLAKKETNRVKRKIIKAKIRDADNKLLLYDNQELDKYKQEIKPLLESYNAKDDGYVDFIQEENKQLDEELVILYNDILKIIEKYIVLKDRKIEKCKYTCSCGQDISNLVSKDDGFIKCRCGIVHKETSERIVYNKDKRTEVDSPIENIKKKFWYFQGLDTKTVPDSVVTKITQYLERHHPHLAPSIIKKLPPSERYSRKTNHDKMYCILSRCGLTLYDPHINRIGHLVWGWELPKVAHLEKDFMDIFFKIISAYRSIKGKDKKSLATGYVSYQIFVLLGQRFPKCWFKIVDDNERLNDTEKYWRISCDLCNDPRIYFLPFNS